MHYNTVLLSKKVTKNVTLLLFMESNVLLPLSYFLNLGLFVFNISKFFF